ETVRYRLKEREGFNVCLFLSCIAATCCKWDSNIKACCLDGLFDSNITAENDHVSDGSACFSCNWLENGKNASKACWLIAFPILLRSKADTSAICTTSVVRTT